MELLTRSPKFNRQADLERIRSLLLQRRGAIINATGDARAIAAAERHGKGLLSALPARSAGAADWSGRQLARVNEALVVPTQVGGAGGLRGAPLWPGQRSRTFGGRRSRSGRSNRAPQGSNRAKHRRPCLNHSRRTAPVQLRSRLNCLQTRSNRALVRTAPKPGQTRSTTWARAPTSTRTAATSSAGPPTWWRSTSGPAGSGTGWVRVVGRGWRPGRPAGASAWRWRRPGHSLNWPRVQGARRQQLHSRTRGTAPPPLPRSHPGLNSKNQNSQLAPQPLPGPRRGRRVRRLLLLRLPQRPVHLPQLPGWVALSGWLF